MKKNLLKVSSFGLVLLLLSGPFNGPVSLAQDSIQADSTEIVIGDQKSQSEENNLEESKAFTKLRDDINSARSTLSNSVVDTSLLEQRLSEVSDEITTLEDQIGQIDKQLKSAKENIKSLGQDIRDNEASIDELMDNIELIQLEISKQLSTLRELLLMIFFENEQTGFFDADDLQTIKLLLGDENVNQVIERAEGLTLLEYALNSLIDELEQNKIKLEEEKSSFQKKNMQLKLMREDLKDTEVNFALQKAAKETVLEQTKGEEKIYQSLIRNAREEQIRIRNDINQLVGDYAKYKIRFAQKGFGDENLGASLSSDKLSWPVDPYLGISAYYRDPTYKAALGIEHNAIDIRSPQNSDLRSAADGVVLKVKGGEGLDYHYVIIGHNNGVMTLYGHMYEIFVEEGDNVINGDLIGRTGAMPGTRGAGWLTTGPHLHFEVFLNGIHVDPLLFMDLTKIDPKYLPAEFRNLIPEEVESDKNDSQDQEE